MGVIEKGKVMSRIRELAKSQTPVSSDITMNQSEIAVLMNTFDVKWNEIDRPLGIFEDDQLRWNRDYLRKEFENLKITLNRSVEKKLERMESEAKSMLKGFLNGVILFDKELAKQFILEINEQ